MQNYNEYTLVSCYLKLTFARLPFSVCAHEFEGKESLAGQTTGLPQNTAADSAKKCACDINFGPHSPSPSLIPRPLLLEIMGTRLAL